MGGPSTPSAAVASSSVERRPVIATVYSAHCNPKATARPMPEPPPVTNAYFGVIATLLFCLTRIEPRGQRGNGIEHNVRCDAAHGTSLQIGRAELAGFDQRAQEPRAPRAADIHFDVVADHK